MQRYQMEVELPDGMEPLLTAILDHYKPATNLGEFLLASLIPDRGFARRQMGYPPEFFGLFDRRWHVGFAPPRSSWISQEHEAKVQHAMDRQAAGLGPIMD